jgi:gliding motility-associated-like protein
MKRLLFILSFVLCLANSKEATASHAAGGELTYEFVSGTTYLFTFKFYRDCTGGPQALDSFGMCYLNTCNSTYYKKFLPRVLTLPNGNPNGTPVSTGCPSPTTCTSPTSVIPGFEEWWYQAEVDLPSQCTEWDFWIVEVARNTQNNIAANGSFNLHIQTSLNNLVAPGNTSPNFSFKPVPYICVNQPWVYNNGAFDADGDSLSYASIVPLTSTNSTNTNGAGNCTFPPVNVNAAATFPAYNAATSPFPSSAFAINPVTGIISAVPTAVGQNVITIEVTEWRNGVAIGKIIRDIQLAIVSCVIPTPTGLVATSNLTNLVYNPTTTFYETCIGDTITYCVLIHGPVDTAQIITSSNAGFILPGSITTITGTGTDSVLICTSWVSDASDTGKHFITYLFQDTSCLYNPIAVTNAITVPLFVIPQIVAKGDTLICPNFSVPLSVTGGNLFSWQALPGGSGNASLSCINCQFPFATPSITTTYVVTSGACSRNKDTVTVEVFTIPVVNAGPDVVMCSNSSYTMQATVTPPGNYTYTWAPATFLNLPSTLNPTVINPTISTTYVLKVVSPLASPCPVYDSMRVTVLSGFKIQTKDTTVCQGANVFVLTTGDNAYSYLWSPPTYVNNVNIKNPIITPDSTTEYTLTASYPGCPDSLQKLKISVEYLPIVSVGADRFICKYDTARLGATIIPDIPDPYYIYAWTPALNLNSASILEPTFSGLTSTTYTLSVKTPKGCEGKDNLVVQVSKGDFLKTVSSYTICPGDTVTLKTSGGSSYYWSPSIWVSDSLAAEVTTSPIATTIYTVYGFDVDGCRDTLTAEVYVAANAVLDAGLDQTIFPGQSAQIYAQGNCSTWQWSPATGLNFTNISNPIAQPSVTTKYIVAAVTEFNCASIDTITVTVANQSLINLPNAFTPGNGSSANDQYKPQYIGTSSLNYFRIFNRWGELVFETTDINAGWDGRKNGAIQPIGTYVYQIDALDNAGKHMTKTGNVTLIR